MLIVLELIFWAAIAIMEALVIAAMFEWNQKETFKAHQYNVVRKDTNE